MERLSVSSLKDFTLNLNDFYFNYFDFDFNFNDLTTLHWLLLSYLFYYFVSYFTNPDKYIVIVTNLTTSKIKIDKSNPLDYNKACDHYQKLITKYGTQVCNNFRGKYKVEIVKYQVYKSFLVK